jgi:hypothetical protein
MRKLRENSPERYIVKKEKERNICSRLGIGLTIGSKRNQDDYGTTPPGGNHSRAKPNDNIVSANAIVARTDKIFTIFFIIFYPPILVLNLPFFFWVTYFM